jgi:parvulin-like peptidyl-prolyl isomerase
MSDKKGFEIDSLVREPLVHFLVLGALVFAVDAWMRPDAASNTIVVSEATVERLRSGYERRHGAAPDGEQTQRLIDAHIREEVLYREGLALGLHKSDPIVRRRMVQATEFLTEDLAPLEEPKDKELKAYLDEHSEAYRKPARVSLQHIYFSGEEAKARAEAALETVRGPSETDDIGDAFVHGSSVRHADQGKLSQMFGEAFAERVLQLEPGTWSEPIASSYGAHLVYVDEKMPAGAPTLDEVRHEVRADWRTEAREEANREAIERLREGYDVRVDWEAP